MTPRVIDVDAVTLVLDRVKGLCELLETFMDADGIDSRPINAAMHCIDNEIVGIVNLTRSSLRLEEAKKLSAEALEMALLPGKNGDE